MSLPHVTLPLEISTQLKNWLGLHPECSISWKPSSSWDATDATECTREPVCTQLSAQNEQVGSLQAFNRLQELKEAMGYPPAC